MSTRNMLNDTNCVARGCVLRYQLIRERGRFDDGGAFNRNSTPPGADRWKPQPGIPKGRLPVLTRGSISSGKLAALVLVRQADCDGLIAWSRTQEA